MAVEGAVGGGVVLVEIQAPAPQASLPILLLAPTALLHRSRCCRGRAVAWRRADPRRRRPTRGAAAFRWETARAAAVPAPCGLVRELGSPPWRDEATGLASCANGARTPHTHTHTFPLRIAASFQVVAWG